MHSQFVSRGIKAFSLNAVSCTSLLLAMISAQAAPQTTSSTFFAAAPRQSGGLYENNRAPLQPGALLKLPPGSITPRGWLLVQLHNEANGMTGHLEQISPYLKFKGNGWVTPDATNGWEELGYWLRGYVALGIVLRDQTIIHHSQHWIDGILKNQYADGWFGPVNLRTAQGGLPDMWPHMLILDALRTWYDYHHDPRVITFLTRYFKFQATVPPKAFSLGWGATRWGDDIASIYWLYNRTGDKFLLPLVTRIQQNSAHYINGLPTMHNVNLSQGFREPAEYGLLSGDSRYMAATVRDYREIRSRYGQFPGGGFAGDENIRPQDTDPRQGIETCGLVELMRSFEMLTTYSGEPAWADRCEDVAFNSLPAALTADQNGLHYITAANSIALPKGGRTLGEFANGTMPMQEYAASCGTYRCCIHNYGMGWPYYAENLWLATPGNGLCASLYASNVVHARVANNVEAAISENTDYPFNSVVRFNINLKRSAVFPLLLRIPRWCNSASISVNAQRVKVQSQAGYMQLVREWHNGDVVTLSLPMSITNRHWLGNKDSLSVNYGPLTLSLLIGEDWKQYGGTAEWPRFSVTATSPWNYALLTNNKGNALDIRVQRRTVATDTNPFTRANCPLQFTALAQRAPGWTADADNVVEPLITSPTTPSGKATRISLIPMGAARLRITAFPWVPQK
jgi:hypothetical protein